MNDNKKKIGTAKVISIIFCLLTIAVLIAVMGVKIYTGGQIKTINNVYTALTHNVYADYQKCFSEQGNYLTESEFDKLYKEYEQSWGEDFHLKADFVSREKLDGQKYKIVVKFVTYNDVTSESENASFILVKQNGKWVISE